MPKKKRSSGGTFVPKTKSEVEDVEDPLAVNLESLEEKVLNNDSEFYKKQMWKIKRENELLIEENIKLKDLNLDLQYELKVLKEKLGSNRPQFEPQLSRPTFKNQSPSISSKEDYNEEIEEELSSEISDISINNVQIDDDIEDQPEEEEEMFQGEIVNQTLTYEPFIEPIISAEGVISLSNENEFLLKIISDDAKDDKKFINQLLLSLYPREEFKNISVTGTPARNGPSKGIQKKSITPIFLNFITERMEERVNRSSGTNKEKQARLKPGSIRCCINQKLQYECKKYKKKSQIFSRSKPVTSLSRKFEEIPVKLEEISLSKQREILLRNISNNSVDDRKFINCLLLGLYKPEELMRLSVTGRTPTNKKKSEITKQPICPQKLLYICSEFCGFSNFSKFINFFCCCF